MRRFPIGLTVAAAIALSLLIGLGVWQLRRLTWKEALLAKIAALEHAAPRPIGAVLNASRGPSAEFTRVQADCRPAPAPIPRVFRYSLREGRIGWRLMTECPLADPPSPFGTILLDRGLVDRLSGAMGPYAIDFPAPGAVTGVLRAPGSPSLLDPASPIAAGGVVTLRVVDAAALTDIARRSGLAQPAPYILAVESERPAPPGVEAAALPDAIANNHFVYALTWFGLGGALIGVYGAMLAGRLRGR